jgi:pimeloyl-ACP methyl ester carboxylesterase
MTSPTWPAAATSEIEDAGIPTHVLDFGGPPDAPLLVFLHGFGGSALTWALLAPRLTSRFRVVVPHLQGHGRTPPGDVRGSMDAVLGQVSALLDRPGPTYLVGNSFGGVMALMAARRDAGRVSGVVVLDSPVPERPDWRLDPVLMAKRLLISIPGMSGLIFRRTTAMTPRAVVEEQVRAAGMDPDTLDADVMDESVALQAARHGDRASHDRQQQVLRSLLAEFERGRRFTTRAAEIRVPVLWLHGEADPMVRVDQGREFVGRMPGWEFRTRPGAGHVPQLDAADWVADELLGWLPHPDPDTD